MDDICIRPATGDDVEVIVEFNCRLAEESEDHRLDRKIITAGVRALLEDSRKGRYFLASCDERIIGQMMHTWEWSDWRNGEIWWLQSVYVASDFRRRGVFRMLYEHVLTEAESIPNVVGIRLYVEQKNNSAHQTYEQMGMKRAGYFVMERLFD